MNFLLLPIRVIWRVLFGVNFLLTFLLLYPFFYYTLHRERLFPQAMWLKRLWAFLIMADVGVFWSVKGREKLKKDQPYVICPNHTSYLDIVVSYRAFPVYFHYMGKKELGQVPFFRIFFKKMNILVDRESKIGSMKALIRAGKDIENGTSVVMFPEGTIPDHTPELKEFKAGPFKLAVEKQVPVVPVTFMENWNILPDNRKKKVGGRPGISRTIIHDPIETRGMTQDDVPALKERVYNIIEKSLKAYLDADR